MVTKPLSPELFREEVERRLIDSFDLMLLLGLRSRQAVWKRVEAGTLPPPVLRQDRSGAFWDRDALPTDRKED